LLFLTTTSLNAQVLKDTASLSIIKKCVDCIYNFQFSEADQIFIKFNNSHLGHPLVYLINGMKTYWEHYPLVTTSGERSSFENDLRTCIELSEKKHNPSDEAEYLLIDLCARGMLLLFYSDNDLSMDVIPLASGTYQYIRRAFDYPEAYADFNFFTGIYNYYREAYPDVHPVYKALAFLFPKGNKAKGIKELQNGSQNSIFLKAESSSFLSNIYISFENDFENGLNYSKSLHERYPVNLQYLSDYIRNMLLVKQYDEAEKLITENNQISNKYYLAQLSVFNGIIEEKKYHDTEKAIKCYNQGVREISLFGDYGNDFAAYAYFGLSRLSDDKAGKHYKKTYRKKALDLASYRKINFDD
jgi:tetratricopeptide (TPR) repeat protein